MRTRSKTIPNPSVNWSMAGCTLKDNNLYFVKDISAKFTVPQNLVTNVLIVATVGI